MNQFRCSQCGAELVLEARFCRQCGVPVPDSLEMPTAVLNDKISNPATQRLESRPTSSERSFTMAEKATTIEARKSRPRWVSATVVFGLVLLVIIGIVASVAYVRMRDHDITSDNALVYPAAKIVADLKTPSDRALQLQTEDSLDRVVEWYDAIIKPTKTMRLTPTNVILRNQKVTVTVAADAGKTNILIKQSL